MTARRELDHYARITLQRELIDSLWKAQAVKMGLMPDTPRWLLQGAVGIQEMQPMLADLFTRVGDELFAFGQSILSAFASGLQRGSTLPSGHGQRYHTNRTRTRR